MLFSIDKTAVSHKNFLHVAWLSSTFTKQVYVIWI